MIGNGMGAGRPRKTPHPQSLGQYAIDAEFQEIADEKNESIELARMNEEYRQSTLLNPIIENTSAFNSSTAAVMLAINRIAEKADRNDINTLYECFNDFLQFCMEHDILITNSMAYAACGLDRFTVRDWVNGKYRSSQPEYKQFARKLKADCSILREMQMANGKINPIIGIFWQKNYDGFSDHALDNEDTEEEERSLTTNEIADKYAGIGDD